MAGEIFISYRRSDSDVVAHRIYDRLKEDFGPDSTFIDVDKMPFTDFRQHISQQINQASVVLVIIGPHWIQSLNEGALRPDDWVRIEIETALEKNIGIAPVLIGEVQHPKEENLPPTIAKLAHINAATVSPALDFHPHMDRLARKLAHDFHLGLIEKPTTSPIVRPKTADLVVQPNLKGAALPPPKAGESWIKLELPDLIQQRWSTGIFREPSKVTWLDDDLYLLNNDYLVRVCPLSKSLTDTRLHTFLGSMRRDIPFLRHFTNQDLDVISPRDIDPFGEDGPLICDLTQLYCMGSGAPVRWQADLPTSDLSTRSIIASKVVFCPKRKEWTPFVIAVSDNKLRLYRVDSRPTKAVPCKTLHIPGGYRTDYASRILWSPTGQYAVHDTVGFYQDPMEKSFLSLDLSRGEEDIEIATSNHFFDHTFTAVGWHPTRDICVWSRYDYDEEIFVMEVLDFQKKDELLRKQSIHTDVVTCLSWNASGSLIATGSRDHTLAIWDLEKDQQSRLYGHGESVKWVEFSHDGQRIVSVGGQKVIVWDGKTGEFISRWDAGLDDFAAAFKRGIWSSDGRMVAYAGPGETLEVRRLEI